MATEDVPDLPELRFLDDPNLPESEKKATLLNKVWKHTQAMSAPAFLERMGKRVEELAHGGPNVLPTLKRDLRSPLPPTRMNAAIALAEHDYPEATDALLDAYCTESSKMVRGLLASALAKRDDPRLEPLFLTTLQQSVETEETERNRLKQNLTSGFLGKAKLMTSVLQGDIPGPTLPTEELAYLAERRSVAAVEPMLQLLRSHELPFLQVALVEALGEIGDPRALPALLELQTKLPPPPPPTDPDVPLTPEAENLLRSIDAVELPDEQKDRLRERVRRMAALSQEGQRSEMVYYTGLPEALTTAIEKLSLVRGD